MPSIKHMRRNHDDILYYCDKPSKYASWCSCKFEFTRTMLIRMLCKLIEALECKCDKLSDTQYLSFIRGETKDPIEEFLKYRKENPYRWTGHIDEDDTWGLSELRDDQM